MNPDANLFGFGEWWEDAWRGMPEFVQHDVKPAHSLRVDFPARNDVDQFAALIGQPLSEDSDSVWYPKMAKENWGASIYNGVGLHPRYPVYVISKGRWESRLTVKALEAVGISHRVVVEPQEIEQYAAVIDRTKLLVLPFSNLGQGSIPARNFVWDHSVSEGATRHWILDDNMSLFLRLNRNSKVLVNDGTIFRAAEDFVDRYENVAIAGLNYDVFAPRRTKLAPFRLNTRIYSCILLRNDLPFRWRGRYNEDTDLSLRALKAGWCTVLFNAFLTKKMATMSMAGGNTAELYADDGRLKMAKSLAEQHPDVTTVTQKWGRAQHQVDYSGFKRNTLKLREGVVIRDGVNDYGMVLKRITEERAA